jgi:hypothetical protein
MVGHDPRRHVRGQSGLRSALGPCFVNGASGLECEISYRLSGDL